MRKSCGEPTGDHGTQRDNHRAGRQSGGHHWRGTEKVGKETSEDGLATTSRALMLALGVSGGGRVREHKVRDNRWKPP